MYDTSLLKTSLFEIKGSFFSNNKLPIDAPWGEVDWQSGKERWKLTYYALFDNYHDINTKISLIPEAIIYIEKESIVINEKLIIFKALSIFRNNPYFSKDVYCLPSLSKTGSFANGEMKIVGIFQILKKAEPVELVSWINDTDVNFKRD